MKIAYVTPYASGDVHAWSGSVYFVREALRKASCGILPVDRLDLTGTKIEAKLISLAYKYLTGKSYLGDRTPAIQEACARQVSLRCQHIGPDVIFSPGTIPIARLESDRPIVFWTDATFAGIRGYYKDFSNLCGRSVRDGNHVDRLALKNCALAIYTSDWAARSAIENYDVDPAKVKVVPYGANVTHSLTDEEVGALVAARRTDEVNLLFVGVDWERKGADIALEAARLLNARGVKTRLHLVGLQPPVAVPDFVTVHGFVSKKTPEGAALLDRLFSQAHFLIVPSRAECFGLVYAESNSFGVPALAASTGGVPTVIRDGVNGKLFPLEDRGEGYADFIQSAMADGYHALAVSSLREFRERLNWDVAGARVVELMRGLL